MNVHTVSIKGERKQNEDKHTIFVNMKGGKPDNTKKNINFYAIYDGHGGGHISDYLSKNLPKYFISNKCKDPVNKKYANIIFDHIQKNIEKIEQAKHCGSTALLTIQYKKNNDNYINVINLGDSRCVLCRDNFALPLTKDHKPDWPEEKHRISAIGGIIVNDGYDWRIKDLSVSRAFGDLDAKPFVTHLPDVFKYKLDKTDKFYVLACDGLWDVLSNQEVINYILDNCYDKTLQNRINKNFNIAAQLAEYALHKGSTDNVSIIVVFLA